MPRQAASLQQDTTSRERSHVPDIPKIPVNPLAQALIAPVKAKARQEKLDAAKEQAATQAPEPTQAVQLVKSTARTREIDEIHNSDHGIHFNLSQEPLDRFTQELLEQPTIEDELRLPMNQQQLTQHVIERAFFEESATLEDLAPYRVKAAWRIVREMCRIKGLAHAEDTLIDALEPSSFNIDPWCVPEPWRRPPSVPLNTLSQTVIKYYKQVEQMSPKFQYKRHVLEAVEGQPDHTVFPGLALLPPEIPWQWWEQDPQSKRHSLAENYDPHEDLALVFYVKVITQIAQELQIEQGSRDDSDQGRFGMKGMTDVEIIRQAFPSRFQIVAYEELLIEETLDTMTRNGQSRARKILRDRHGLTRREIEALCKIAKAYIRKQIEADIEEDRAFMVTRLEEFVLRARGAMDLRAELAGMKQLTIVLGLARSEMGDAMSDFLNVVSEVSGARGDMPKIEEGDFEVIR